jgi:hypothetical protein
MLEIDVRVREHLANLLMPVDADAELENDADAPISAE